MDVSQLTKNPERVHKAFKEVDNKLIVVEACAFHIPSSYVGTPLASIEGTITIIAIFGIVVGEYYAVSMADAMVEIKPGSQNEIEINEVKYIEFKFVPGDVAMVSLNLVQTQVLLFRIFNQFNTRANIPWYIKYHEMGQLFDTAILHANGNLHTNHAILELIPAIMARDPDDKHNQIRIKLKTQKELDNFNPYYVPLTSVGYGTTNTTSKLLGNYVGEAITSALVNPSETIDPLEEALRK